jgi:hypothetical protein
MPLTYFEAWRVDEAKSHMDWNPELIGQQNIPGDESRSEAVAPSRGLKKSEPRALPPPDALLLLVEHACCAVLLAVRRGSRSRDGRNLSVL